MRTGVSFAGYALWRTGYLSRRMSVIAVPWIGAFPPPASDMRTQSDQTVKRWSQAPGGWYAFIPHW